MAVDATAVIQATLAPIFLVSGAAIFLNFTQARLFRVVDRLRAIAKDIHGEKHDMPIEELRWQRRWHLNRAVLLRNAILFGVLVIAFTVATTLLILLPSILPRADLGGWAIGTFACALVSFAGALALVVSDAFMSVASVKRAAREFGEDDPR